MKRIVVQTQVYFILPVIILLFPNGWVLSWIVAVTIHEGFHLLAIRLFGVKILSIEIGIAGAKIETESIQPFKEWLIALAGPLGALLVLFITQYCPRVAICVIAQSLYNLLPVYPLDGGRALRCLLAGRIKDQQRIVAERCILYVIVFYSLIVGLYLRLGIFPIVLSISLLIKYRNANIPCKARTHRVQ